MYFEILDYASGILAIASLYCRKMRRGDEHIKRNEINKQEHIFWRYFNMRIMSKEQISELLTRMVEQHAPDEDLAVVIRYSEAYISGRRDLDKICQEYGLYRYLTTCVPSLSEVSSKLATLIAKKDCTLDAEHMILLSARLLKFYEDLEKYSIEQAIDTIEADRYYETGVFSGHCKLYELLEEIDKGGTV